MNFKKHSVTFLLLPALLSVLSIGAILAWGLKPSIDLAGGSLLQVSYANGRPPAEQVQTLMDQFHFGEVRVQPSGDNAYILRMPSLTNDQKNQVEAVLGGLGAVHEDQYTSIGPSIGTETLHKGLIAIAVVLVLIILFIAFAFRQVSEPVASWKYGIVAVITLFHDILIPTGLFALLGAVRGAEVDSLFIVGLLTVLGISINDTIVVFDRIRENLRRNAEGHRREEFAETVGRSTMQTLARSINTSLTVVIVLAALYFFGPAATQNFSLTLIVGMIAGTYSSILLASPLLVLWERVGHKKR